MELFVFALLFDRFLDFFDTELFVLALAATVFEPVIDVSSQIGSVSIFVGNENV